jgi:hypothetical protein
MNDVTERATRFIRRHFLTRDAAKWGLVLAALAVVLTPVLMDGCRSARAAMLSEGTSWKDEAPTPTYPPTIPTRTLTPEATWTTTRTATLSSPTPQVPTLTTTPSPLAFTETPLPSTTLRMTPNPQQLAELLAGCVPEDVIWKLKEKRMKIVFDCPYAWERMKVGD